MKKIQNLQAPDPEPLFQELDDSQSEKVLGASGPAAVGGSKAFIESLHLINHGPEVIKKCSVDPRPLWGLCVNSEGEVVVPPK